MDWDSIYASRGGLGIKKIVDKNWAIFSKWFRRFGMVGEALWKNVLCAKYGLDSSRMSLVISSRNGGSQFSKNLFDLWHGVDVFS